MSKETPSGTIERVGAGGPVGEGQAGAPLHKPQGRRDRELGERERVGAGGPVGDKEQTGGDRGAAIDEALHEVIEKEIARRRPADRRSRPEARNLKPARR